MPYSLSSMLSKCFQKSAPLKSTLSGRGGGGGVVTDSCDEFPTYSIDI